MRVMVTGRQGQVVRALMEAGEAGGETIVAAGRPDMDLADPASVEAAIHAARPAVVVSAAAYTGVDKAEAESDLAFAVNGTAPGAIGRAAAALGIPVVHLSTDYVFDGAKETPYEESDPVGPLGVYGASKLAGEAALVGATDDYAILRTAWVYSPFGANFVKTMLRLAADREELRVVDDQRGNPTSALDIATAVLAVAHNLVDRPGEASLRGVFHLGGTGACSWAEFAREIFTVSAALGGPSARVVPITTADYPTPAARPKNSRLSTVKLATAHGVILPQWQSSMRRVVERLLQ